jgi:transposase
MTTTSINNLVDELKKLIKDRGREIIENIDFGPIEKILKRLKPKRGRPPTYSRLEKLKAVIYGFAHGKYNACAIAREVDSFLGRRICGLKGKISHDRINSFLKELPAVIEEILKELVRQVIALGVTKGKSQALDSTSVKTRFTSDQDAKWSYDETRGEYYFGYGLLVNFCTETHLPLAAEFTQSKKISYKETKRTIKKTPVKPEKLFGDAEFDIVKLHKSIMDEDTLVVVPYNPRNTKEPLRIKYRIQQWKPGLSDKELDREYRARAEAEHGFSSLKEHFGLESFSVRGWNRVKVHAFLCLILRLMHAIAVHKTSPGISVRRTITVL